MKKICVVEVCCANVLNNCVCPRSGNFSKFPVGKKGENVKLMGFHWIVTGISQFGKMQQYPFLGQVEPRIYLTMGFFRHKLSPVVGFLVSNNPQCCDFIVSIFSHCWDLTVSIVSQCWDFIVSNLAQ